MSDPFWIYDPSVFLDDGNWYKIIPMKGMSTVEALNSLSLLVFYVSLIAFVFTFNATFIITGIILIGGIVLYYYYLDSKDSVQLREDFDHQSLSNTSAFVKHAYGDLKSCKDNPSHCTIFSDTRRARHQY